MSSKQDALRVRKAMRQICRTDLLKLCNVLGYPDVNRAVHGPIIDVLQQFPGGTDTHKNNGTIEYAPFKKLWELDGSRKTLILYPRGHLKTTLVTQAHLIQWIINYPNIRILISCFTGDQIENVVRKIKGVFQHNEFFRALFPEFCPPRERANDFGTKDQFITPARNVILGEPTVFSVTVGKTIAGYHPDVIFHSDLVDKENIKTPGAIKDTTDHFKYMNPLLERYSATPTQPASRGWVYVEGTPYDFGDLHNDILDNRDGAFDGWARVVKPAQEDFPHGKILWPERFPALELANIRKDMGEWMFSAQYLMKCIPEGDGLCDTKDVIFIPQEVISNLLPTMRLHVAIDTSNMDPAKRGDYTVLTVGGFDRDGRLYIIDCRCGRYSPEDVVDLIFYFHKQYPAIIDYKMEADVHACMIMPTLQRETSKRSVYPIITPIKRDTQISKQTRIKGLRPWFKKGIIRFNQNLSLSVRQELLSEIAKFPSQSSGVHDDILDTLADLMQDGEGGVTMDVIADSPDMKFSQFGRERPQNKFLGFNEEGVSRWLYGNEEANSWERSQMTGVL